MTTFRPARMCARRRGRLERLGAVLVLVRRGRRDDDRDVVSGGGTQAAARLPGAGGEALDCGNSGTTMRLFSGALAGRPRRWSWVGDASLSRRPMERVAAPLRRMGAIVETTDGHAPLRITGRRPAGRAHPALPVASAQVLGAVTLAALAARGTTIMEVPGPTRDHTERLLAWMGVPVVRDGLRTTIEGPAGMRARSLDVPGDISSAATWLVAAAVHPDPPRSACGTWR